MRTRSRFRPVAWAGAVLALLLFPGTASAADTTRISVTLEAPLILVVHSPDHAATATEPDAIPGGHLTRAGDTYVFSDDGYASGLIDSNIGAPQLGFSVCYPEGAGGSKAARYSAAWYDRDPGSSLVNKHEASGSLSAAGSGQFSVGYVPDDEECVTGPRPAAGPDACWIKEFGAVEVPAPGVLANDGDLGASTLTARVVATNFARADHPYKLKPNGALSFQAKATPGHRPYLATITYRAVDSAGVPSLPAKVRIYIQPTRPKGVVLNGCGGDDGSDGVHGQAKKKAKKHLLEAHNDAATYDRDARSKAKTAKLRVLENDEDSKGHDLHITGVGSPLPTGLTYEPGSVVEVLSDGDELLFKVPKDYVGKIAAAYTVSDEHGKSDKAKATVEFRACNTESILLESTGTSIDPDAVGSSYEHKIHWCTNGTRATITSAKLALKTSKKVQTVIANLVAAPVLKGRLVLSFPFRQRTLTHHRLSSEAGAAAEVCATPGPKLLGLSPGPKLDEVLRAVKDPLITVVEKAQLLTREAARKVVENIINRLTLGLDLAVCVPAGWAPSSDFDVFSPDGSFAATWHSDYSRFNPVRFVFATFRDRKYSALGLGLERFTHECRYEYVPWYATACTVPGG